MHMINTLLTKFLRKAVMIKYFKKKYLPKFIQQISTVIFLSMVHQLMIIIMMIIITSATITEHSFEANKQIRKTASVKFGKTQLQSFR